MSSAIVKGRVTATFAGPVTVFFIGMRINRLRRVAKWLPIVRAMRPMIQELVARPESGYLGSEITLRDLRTVCMIQYWRDFDSLEAYARDRDQSHWPAWSAFNKAVGNDGAVGIFHETYTVPAGGYETIYVNMPPICLGRVAGLQQATGSREKARSRMRAAVVADADVEDD